MHAKKLHIKGRYGMLPLMAGKESRITKAVAIFFLTLMYVLCNIQIIEIQFLKAHGRETKQVIME